MVRPDDEVTPCEPAAIVHSKALVPSRTLCQQLKLFKFSDGCLIFKCDHCSNEKAMVTRVIDLMKGAAEHFERTAKLLSSKRGV